MGWSRNFHFLKLVKYGYSLCMVLCICFYCSKLVTIIKSKILVTEIKQMNKERTWRKNSGPLSLR